MFSTHSLKIGIRFATGVPLATTCQHHSSNSWQPHISNMELLLTIPLLLGYACLKPLYELLILKQSRQIPIDKKIGVIERFHTSMYSTEVVNSMKGFYGICWDDQPNEIFFCVRQI